jgi:hypothetical protein
MAKMKYIILAALLALAACQPANNGAGGATINAFCTQSGATASPAGTGYAAVHDSCVVVITPGSSTNTPTNTVTVPVSATPSIP